MRPSKRLFDLVCAMAGLLLLWPLLLAVAVLIKLTDGGTVFFRQERVGHRGKTFRIWKFRTMVPDAERLGRQLTVGRDLRITWIGHFLRQTKLDELPQLLNVVVGDMSLVGPRPEVPRYVALYSPEQRGVLELVPGITDLASIRYRDESTLLASADDPERIYISEIMPEKIRINFEYARKATVWGDFLIIMKTLTRLGK